MPMAAERPRILATDDRPEVLSLVQRSLRDRFECELATDVAGARRALAEREFDLVLCDIEMPGESGLVLVEEIARERADIAIVLVTGVDDPEVARRAFELGAHGYLVKPFWPGQLLITVMTALRRRELEMAQRAHSRTLEQRIQTLMDRAPVPIYIKDRQRRYLLANRAAHEVAELEPGELIGRTDAEIMPAESERIVAETDLRVLGGEETFEREETIRVGDVERTFLTVKFPYVDDAGRVAGVSGVSADITAKRKAEVLQQELAEAQAHAIEEMRTSRLETVERLSRALEMHDAVTGTHINRMALVAELLASRLDLAPDRVQLLREAAPMHDVGKIATPDAILRKPGSLSSEEREVMERHTEVGHEILAGSDSDLLRMAARIALTHHERWDGSGYPRGLRGEEIPLEGRIVAVADVFDALLSERPYRAAMSLREAAEAIREGRGNHFDPAVADALLENLDQAAALRG
jgi:putative two-component system response regulator